MTYAVSNLIVASDYVTFRGVNDTSVAYTSGPQSQNAVAALLGVGYASRGYGYTGLPMPLIRRWKKAEANCSLIWHLRNISVPLNQKN